MPRFAARRLLAGLLLAPLALTACGSGTSSPPTTAPPGMLSKAATISQIDAVCKDTDAKLSALPQASGRDDYASLLTDFTSTVTLFNSYFAQVQPLVEQSVDRDRLTTKWLAVEKSDFAASQPIIEQMIQALQAKDDSAISAAQSKLNKAPDHTDEIISFFRSYGLKDCATMQGAT